MKTGTAFLAGMVGGAVMTAMLWMGRVMGMDVNLSMMLGTMFIQPPGATAWVVGFIMHLVISGLIALVYAWGFERVTQRAGPAVGAGFGVIHAIIAGLMFGMIPLLHPLIPEQMPAPGMFMAEKGALYVVMMFVVHMIYGAVVGSIYGPVAEPAAHGARATA